MKELIKTYQNRVNKMINANKRLSVDTVDYLLLASKIKVYESVIADLKRVHDESEI